MIKWNAIEGKNQILLFQLTNKNYYFEFYAYFTNKPCKPWKMQDVIKPKCLLQSVLSRCAGRSTQWYRPNCCLALQVTQSLKTFPLDHKRVTADAKMKLTYSQLTESNERCTNEYYSRCYKPGKYTYINFT